MKYSFTECIATDQTASVFFYYDKEEKCDTRKGMGSETLPSYIDEVPCDHLCEHDGYMSKFDGKTP